MLCVRCGFDNSHGSRYCSKCNAVMMQAAPDSTTSSVIDVEEGMEYLSPEKNYDCQWLSDFVDVLGRFSQGDVDLEEVKRVYGNIRKIYESFDNQELPDFLNELDGWRHSSLGKEYSRQMTYLLTKGFQLMGEGLDIAREYFDDTQNDARLRNALEKLQDGVNQIGLAEEFLGVHQQIMEEEISRREMESRAEDFKAKVDSQKPQSEEEAEVDA